MKSVIQSNEEERPCTWQFSLVLVPLKSKTAPAPLRYPSLMSGFSVHVHPKYFYESLFYF